MGCGISKPGTIEESVGPQGSRTIRRRIEEMTGLNRTITNSNASRKLLLPDVREEVDEHTPPDSPHDNPRKSVSLPENKEDSGPMLSKEATLAKGMAASQEERTEVEKKQKEEDGKNDEDGLELAPGSPSFREYYVASVDSSLDSADTNKDNDANYGLKTEKTTQRKDSSTSSEGSVTGSVKKGGKRRFRRGLPKGGQAAVKNLLNVKSCYSPTNAASHHDNSQLLNVKVTAA